MKKVFYISPDGNDNNDGSAKRPWASIVGARNAIRDFRKNGDLTGDALVIIKKGIHRFTDVVDFNPEDSNTTYRAEEEGTVIFDGSELICGFREGELNGRKIWCAEIPNAKLGRWYFRSLFVNNERRPRARIPKFSPDAEGVKNVFRIAEIRFPEKRKLFDGDNMFKPRDGDFKSEWRSLADAEIVLLHYWVETRLGAPYYDTNTGWVTCSRRSVFNLYESFNPKFARYYIDNLKEALTEPGEWYLDRQEGKLYYVPRKGEQFRTTQVSAPRVKVFLRINGYAFNRGREVLDVLGAKHVENLNFEGITFRNSDWFAPIGEMLSHDKLRTEDVPLGGSSQGAVHVPGAIEMRWCRNCSIANCKLENIGLTAIAIERGCRECSVTNSTIRNVGAGGVRIGGSELDEAPADRTGYITISDNKISEIGRVFQQGIGVLLTHAFNCKVIHNEIARTCYTGISCGWSWGYRETISRNNLIENNYIHDIGQGVLSDMGGIYLLGVQPGTMVRGNHIHDVTSADYGGWGIYPDEGSAHILIEGNWVHDTQGSPFRIHFGRELVVRNNVFARSREEGLIGIGKTEGHISANIFGNILIGPAKCVFEGGYEGDVRVAFRSDANLIWFPEGKIPLFLAYPDYRKDAKPLKREEWLAIGNDRRSIIEDPLMRENKNDLSFPKNSPAEKVGFRKYNWKNCGPRRKK